MFRETLRTISIISALTFASSALSEPLAKEYFGHVNGASSGPSASIGQYALGCISGAVQLPETGPTWQAMRLSRNRNWGHPELVNFIQRLSQTAVKSGWAGLYVGDMSQPRGGPMLTGHASHQTGLDADIWMLPAKRLNLTPNERENLSSISVVSNDFKRMNGNWSQAHYNILKAAATDPAVARIFVTPAVKIAMCDVAGGDKSWLRKIRPWWGHNYHFHVRLNCQAGSSGCENQAPIPAGDGCAQAREFYGMFISKTIKVPPSAPAKPSPAKTLSIMPQQCQALVR